jgi:hypothetical protein
MKMKKTFSIIIMFAFVGSLFSACKKADPILRNSAHDLSDIYATLEGKGGDRLFDARFSANKDTVYFDIPYYYPVDSDNEVDLSKLILRGTIPADAILSPGLGQVIDLTKPVRAEVASGTGEKSSFVIVAKKVGDLNLRSAKIEFESGGVHQELEGIVKDNEVLFYVVPGTDVSKSKLTVEINRHSTSSIASGTEINLGQNVPLTITGVEGSKKTFTLKAVEPVKLNYGVGINRKLWIKTGAELSFTTDNQTAIAVSGDYLVLVSKVAPNYQVFNRYTGAYVRNMTVPFSGQTHAMVGDTSGNLLGCNYAGPGGKFYVYKWTSPTDPNPVKLIEWTNNTPSAPNSPAWGMGVGRAINVYGDVNHDAVITTTGTSTNAFQKWTIRNGQLVSNTPETIIYKGVGSGNLGVWSEAQPISTAANGNYFMGSQDGVKLVNGSSNDIVTGLTFGWPVVYTRPIEYGKFNNANFLAIVKYVNSYSLNQVHMSLFDVTQTQRISLAPSDPAYPTFNVFNSDLFTGATNSGTADIAIGYSADKERMQVYMLLTNGGIMAHEFTRYAP